MKIAFLVHEFPPQIGGISARAYRISKGLSERGHEITVYTSVHPRAPRVERMDGIKVERYNLLSPHIARFIKAPMMVMPGLFKLFGKKEIVEADIVHSFSFLMFVSLVAASLKLVQKKVFILNPLFFPYYAPRTPRKYIKWSVIPYRLTFGTAILKSADLLAPETSLERESLIRFGIPSDKIRVIPNAINPEDYKRLPEPMIFRDKYGIDANEKIVLFLSRPTEYKGIDHLILAMQDVLRNVKEAKLVVVGPHLRRPHILRDSLPPNVRDRIIITGPVTEEYKMSAYSAADVFVLPSKIETFAIVLLEAAAAGLPIVCTKTGVAPDIVINGKNGLFVGWGKVNQLSNAIIKVLMDSNFRKEAKKRRNLVLKNYDIKTELDQYERICMQLAR